MARIDDALHDEPTEPPFSCPEFDAVLKELKTLQGHLEEGIGMLDDARGSKGNIEDARTINEDLRAWGSYWKEVAEKLSDEIDELEAKRDELELRIYKYNKDPMRHGAEI